MPNTFPAVLHPPVPVTFTSSYPLAESVERLRAATVPLGFDVDSSESVVGVVTPELVRLERNRPWPRNQFLRPYFVGAFEEKHETILTGQFIGDSGDSRIKFFVGTLAGTVFFGPRTFRNDVVWLTAVIEQALSERPDNVSQPTAVGSGPT